MTFQLSKNGRLAMAPDFLPLSLVQVIDVPPGEGLEIQTVVPATSKFISYYRGTSFAANGSVYYETYKSNGFWRLKFYYGMAYQPVRVYIFSDYLVNIPNWGFFVYNDGEIVWHSNCLPLKIMDYSKIPAQVLSYPVACPSGVTQFTSVGNNVEHWERWFVWAAGVNQSGTYSIGAALFSQFNASGPAGPGSFTLPLTTYIETSVYDLYYKQALGY